MAWCLKTSALDQSSGLRSLSMYTLADNVTTSKITAFPPPCDYFFTRDEFNLKLTLLSNQWQGVVRRAQQRRGIIDSQIRQWQRYREMAEKLRKWLVEVSYLPTSGLGSVPIPLQQARTLFDEVQVRRETRCFETSSTIPLSTLASVLQKDSGVTLEWVTNIVRKCQQKQGK